MKGHGTVGHVLGFSWVGRGRRFLSLGEWGEWGQALKLRAVSAGNLGGFGTIAMHHRSRNVSLVHRLP